MYPSPKHTGAHTHIWIIFIFVNLLCVVTEMGELSMFHTPRDARRAEIQHYLQNLIEKEKGMKMLNALVVLFPKL